MKASFLSAIVALTGAATVSAADSLFRYAGRLVPPVEESEHADVFPAKMVSQVNATGSAFFDQLLDHNDPSKGTFPQKFWWNSEFWEGPGSPVVLFTPGEISAAGYGSYLTNITITGLYAQEIKGAVVMVEHRFWGSSSPYAELTAETLQLLTLDQAIADFVYFAKTVALPFDANHSSNADKAPWVFSGGSYSGALSAWTESTAPGTFWAYHASSAPVEAIFDYWQYFAPIQEGMPKNCSKDVSAVIDYMDNVWAHGTDAEKLALKTNLVSNRSNTMTMSWRSALENGPWLWQSNSFYTGYSAFYQFCDKIENVTAGAAVTPDENGVGYELALEGYAVWVKEILLPGYCANLFGYPNDDDLSCLDTYDPNNKMYTDRTVGNGVDLQWNWMLCNEPFAYWQDGAPPGTASIVSRLVNGQYWQRQCELFFPTVNGYTYGSNISADNNVHQVNKHTQGWRLEDTTRLIWTNGEFDPWRTSGISSEFRPGGPLASTEQHPVQVIPSGIHCSDLRLKNGQVNAGVQQVIDNEVAQIVKWVEEYPKKY
ncbi:putative extracellular serine carboxypeptidase [Lachnellula subtilissima]|uniref:Putative extracellular serine carboxypeptidase n=1 Tax=Lachnellula subtilissima TaxID=602034 RepID=A0A8H8RDI6_9HELO|nr:putative extracellular serine carboxypeptidase [Lachnellula subtilissima]